jgi:hypothetical protein
MPGDRNERYQKYETPQEPKDPEANLLNIQETAYVLGCSVRTVHRRLDELGLKRKPGRRVMTTKADRQALLDDSLTQPQKAATLRRGRRGNGRKQLTAALAA